MLDKKIYQELKQIENPSWGISMRKNEESKGLDFDYVVYEKGKGLLSSVLSVNTKEIGKLGNFMHVVREGVEQVSEELKQSEKYEDLKKLSDSVHTLWMNQKETQKKFQKRNKSRKQEENKKENGSYSSVYNQVVEQASVQQVMESYDLRIEKSGKSAKTMCCFHDDHDPSLHILPNDKGWVCFVCHEKGNAITFVQKYETQILGNRSFTMRDAVNKVIALCGLNIEPVHESEMEQKQKYTHNHKEYSEEEKEKLQLFERLTKIGEYTLSNTDHKQAKQYLLDRGLTEEMIQTYRFGWIPKEQVQKWIDSESPSFPLTSLEEIGFISRGKNGVYYPTYGDRILIPVMDERGNPVTYSGRTMGDEKPKYLLGKTSPVFTKDNQLYNFHVAKQVAYQDKIIVLEGFMDVIAGHKIGLDNLVATMGTSISEQQLDMMKRLKAEVCLCRDNDVAGQNAMLKEIPRLLQQGMRVSVVDLKELSVSERFKNQEGAKKDLLDFVNLGLEIQDINFVTKSGLAYLLEYEYFANKTLEPDTIYTVYVKLSQNGLIHTQVEEDVFISYVQEHATEEQSGEKVAKYTSGDIRNIIHNQSIEKKSALMPLLKNLLQVHLAQQTEKGLQKIEKYSGLVFQSSLKETIRQSVQDTFYQNPEYYLTDDLQTIDVSSLLQTNSSVFKNDYTNEKEQRAISLALTLTSYQSQNVKNESNDGIYHYLRTKRHIHPEIIRTLLEDDRLLQYMDANNQYHFAFLHRNENGILQNVTDHSFSDTSIPKFQVWEPLQEAYRVTSENRDVKLALCFPNTVELLSYQSLLLKKGIPLDTYEYLSVEGNQLDCLESYCEMNQTKKIAFLFNNENDVSLLPQQIEKLQVKYPSVQFENGSMKVKIGNNYNEMLTKISEANRTKEREREM